MKKLIFSILVSLFSICAFAQKDNKVTIGTIDSLQSKILGEQRKIWVYLPNGDGANDLYSSQKYPVVYLLDGDAHFYSVVGMIQQLSQVNGNTVLPEMIAVGIPNTDRTRDLTPTHMDFAPNLNDSAFVRTSGGGENFIAFIEKELMPFVESKYPTTPYKLLIGHSLGGLIVMQTLVHHTQLFNSYICIDPSMRWDNQKLLNEAKMFLKDTKLEGKSFYLGFANTMNEGMDIKQVVKDTAMDTEHIRSILELQTVFEKNNHNGLHYKGRYYNDDDHGSVPLIAEYDALRWIFQWHAFKGIDRIFSSSSEMTSEEIQDHYKEVSKHFGYEVLPPEMLINGIGYFLLLKKMPEKASVFFELNIMNYPNSSNVYDSYGDYFLAVGDKTKAIEQFEKAIAIKEHPESRKKLNALLE